MTQGTLCIIFISMAGLVAAAPASAQIPPETACADCHYARPEAPRREHLEAWDRSPHGRNRIGCERCHGGNPKVFETLPAHAGIIASGNVKSPVNRRNLPATCGSCHTGPFVAFQDSRHFALLQSGETKGPTCSTCHGDVDARVLSPKALAAQCDQCHGPGEVAPRAERARQVREQYEGLTVVREQLKLALTLIRRVDDQKRRATLMAAYEQAQVPLTRAINAGHRFVYDELREYRGIAEKRVEELLSSLANR
jgi:nitrate/TMAO reductase-like tetraheme cytochrome c subunit